MSQNTNMPILGLTKTNYNAPRMSNNVQTITSQQADFNHIIQDSPIVTHLLRIPTPDAHLYATCKEWHTANALT